MLSIWTGLKFCCLEKSQTLMERKGQTDTDGTTDSQKQTD